MKKGITPVIAVVLLIMMTFAIASAFFYWFSAIQDTGQEMTSTNLRVAEKRFITKAESLIDPYYTTIEELDVNAFADFKVYICNNGDGPIDLTSKKGISIEDLGRNKIICVENVLDGTCLQNGSHLVAGLGFAGSIAPDAGGMPPAIINSTDGVNWGGVGGHGYGAIGTTENIMGLAMYAVKPSGESPLNFWSISNNTNEGRLAWAEFPNSTWQFRTTGGNPGMSLAHDVTDNILFIGVKNATKGVYIAKVDPIFGDNVDVKITNITGTNISYLDFDTIKVYADGTFFLAGTGKGTGDGVNTFGVMYRAANSDWGGFEAVIYSPAPPGLPNLYLRINDFAATDTRIYAAATQDTTLGPEPPSVSDVIYTDSPGDNGATWTSTEFKTEVSSTDDVRAIVALPNTEIIYVGHSNSTNATLSSYDTATWTKSIQIWNRSVIYDLAVDDTTGYIYASIGATTKGGVIQSEVWRSGPNLNDANWSRVYLNAERGAATAIMASGAEQSEVKCTKQNVYCVSGCNITLSPGDCIYIILALEGSNCDLSGFSPETKFKLDFTAGRYFTQTFNFKKEQDPANESKNDGTYQ